MSKVIINENQRGFLFKNGQFIQLLSPGKYHAYWGKKIETVSVLGALESEKCELDTLLNNEEIAKAVSVTEVLDQQLVLHYINGNFYEVLEQGKYAFWTVVGRHEYNVVDISTPDVSSDIPTFIFAKIPPTLYTMIEVTQYQKARLYFNQNLIRVLDPGTYYFWKTNIRVDVELVDTRLTQMNIIGQEILTQDKVSVRINFVCNYRITDYISVKTNVDDYKEQIHVAAQLALRDFVGKYRMDDILENKEQLTQYIFNQLKTKEKDLYVEITDAGVKDIILPGEIREIMNTVLVAEKRAQTNVITRREEVASTRSLLNTAKLMDENKTLYKLKELEYVERICENVGSINVNGDGTILSQLSSILNASN